ncbi:MAG: hypothetical protein Q7S00_06895, partial [bacterium]|nr:hypothetical protein [bacterium]
MDCTDIQYLNFDSFHREQFVQDPIYRNRFLVTLSTFGGPDAIPCFQELVRDHHKQFPQDKELPQDQFDSLFKIDETFLGTSLWSDPAGAVSGWIMEGLRQDRETPGRQSPLPETVYYYLALEPIAPTSNVLLTQLAFEKHPHRWLAYGAARLLGEEGNISARDRALEMTKDLPRVLDLWLESPPFSSIKQELEAALDYYFRIDPEQSIRQTEQWLTQHAETEAGVRYPLLRKIAYVQSPLALKTLQALLPHGDPFIKTELGSYLLYVAGDSSIPDPRVANAIPDNSFGPTYLQVRQHLKTVQRLFEDGQYNDGLKELEAARSKVDDYGERTSERSGWPLAKLSPAYNDSPVAFWYNALTDLIKQVTTQKDSKNSPWLLKGTLRELLDRPIRFAFFGDWIDLETLLEDPRRIIGSVFDPRARHNFLVDHEFRIVIKNESDLLLFFYRMREDGVRIQQGVQSAHGGVTFGEGFSLNSTNYTFVREELPFLPDLFIPGAEMVLFGCNSAEEDVGLDRLTMIGESLFSGGKYPATLIGTETLMVAPA